MSIYEELNNIKIEFENHTLSGIKLSKKDIETAKIAIDDIFFDGIETLRVDDQKSVIVKLSARYALIVDGQESQCMAHFTACRTQDDDLSVFELDDDDLHSAHVISDFRDAGEHFIDERSDEILHLVTLAPDWSTLKTWIKSELRYRLSY